jgi:hypothetical protein
MATATKTKPKPAPQQVKPAAQQAKSGKAVATVQAAGLPASVAAAAAAHAGKGISDRMEDNIVPLIYLLQANSKVALKGHERYVEGATGGAI